ncbi:collagen-like protein [Spongiimicrobium salis]|uniref:collagen-like protein n=1 Tax=Spongiimicrobium salis TaxID=1667022 RepID=UPI00374C9CC8
MKKLNLLLGAFLTLFILSCEGPEGPPGFDGLDGRDGQDGVNVTGTVIDIEGTFDAGNNYRIFYEFPQTIEVLETDVVLVFLQFDQTSDTNGQAVDIWRPLPQTLIVNQGLLQYNFEHTFFDVDIFLDADFDFGLLLPGDTDNQVFRIAVIPADQLTGKLDTSNINAVMSNLGISESDVQRVKL